MLLTWTANYHNPNVMILGHSTFTLLLISSPVRLFVCPFVLYVCQSVCLSVSLFTLHVCLRHNSEKKKEYNLVLTNRSQALQHQDKETIDEKKRKTKEVVT